MNLLTDILINILLGLLGLGIFTAWAVREHLSSFSWSILITKNIPYWIWSIIMLLLFSVLIVVAPEGADAIKTMTGLDLKDETAALITLGVALGRIARDIQKQSKKNKDASPTSTNH